MKKLAKDLWKNNKEGNTWSSIILLKDLTNFKNDISVKYFNEIMSYKKNNIIQGCMILKANYKKEITKLFNEIEENKITKFSEEELVKKDYKDYKVLKAVRAEQKDLRAFLFRNKTHKFCSICCQSFEIKHLVAAHIKKREKCSNKEKKDLKNIAIPMCLYGCDTSFEKGEILVNDKGKIEINFKKSNPSKKTKEYLKKLNNKKIINYNAKNEKYFKFHFNYWKK